MISVRMAIDSILAKKVRSILTMLGIIIGVTAVLVLISIVEGYNADMTTYYEKLGVNKVEVSVDWLDEGRAEDLTADLSEYMLNETDGIVTAVTPYALSVETLQYDTNSLSSTETLFVGEQYTTAGNYTLQSGRDILSYDIENRNAVCVIGAYVAQSLFQYTDPIGQEILVGGNPFTVVGVYYQKDGATEGSMDHMITVPYTMSRQMLGSDVLNEYIIKVDSSSNMDSAMLQSEYWFSEAVRSTAGTVTVENGNAAMSETQDEIASMSVVLGGIAAIALLVGGIGIMNIMLVTVSERTREIGIKKAVGAPHGDIISQFLIEASILSALGGLIGIVLGYALSLILGQMIYGLILLPAALISVGAFAFSVLIGVGFGLYPAIKAAKLQPVDALRVE